MTTDRIFFNVVQKDGTLLSDAPIPARYCLESDGWVDNSRGIVVRFLGLVYEDGVVFSSRIEQDVIEWAKEQDINEGQAK